jgi:hypothetical protein
VTAPRPTVERDGNVSYLRRHQTEQPARPPVTGPPAPGTPSREEAAPARRRVTLRGAWRRSQLRRDLKDCGWLMGLIAGGLICVVYRDELHHLAHALFGGNR